ncbi:Tripartite motif-containing protein 65 [Entophlyctis luteolus]|nr:Tripartite motif-containing protein 65 [Entophlyctis luteolus]
MAPEIIEFPPSASHGSVIIGRTAQSAPESESARTIAKFVANTISKSHALLLYPSVIVDQRSANGTAVNGVRLYPGVPTDLAVGDVVVFAVPPKETGGGVKPGRPCVVPESSTEKSFVYDVMEMVLSKIPRQTILVESDSESEELSVRTPLDGGSSQMSSTNAASTKRYLSEGPVKSKESKRVCLGIQNESTVNTSCVENLSPLPATSLNGNTQPWFNGLLSSQTPVKLNTLNASNTIFSAIDQKTCSTQNSEECVTQRNIAQSAPVDVDSLHREGVQLFSAKLLEQLTCSICFECMVAPHTLSCSHAFCGLCIDDWVKTGYGTCPQCRTKFSTQKNTSPAVPNALLLSIIETMRPYFSTEELASRAEREREWEDRKILRQSISDPRSNRAQVRQQRLPVATVRHNPSVDLNNDGDDDDGDDDQDEDNDDIDPNLYVIEEARSGRSTCRTCFSLIRHGALRFAVSQHNRNLWIITILYHHLLCLSPRIPGNVRSMAHRIPGFELLNSRQRAAVLGQ